MNIIFLSGGSGTRLWPLSNEVRSKQFIKIFRTPEGGYESMVQRVYRQLMSVDSRANVIFATSKTQVSAIQNQLGGSVGICVEPCRRDTFPAIALAAAYLRDVKEIGEDDVVVVCPVDPYVNTDYFEAIQTLSERAAQNSANLTLMGIEPTYPSEKYGYIIPETNNKYSKVATFKEKPDKPLAQAYIGQGALWNGGVFAFKLGYPLQKAREILGFAGYKELLEHYETLDKISFDYAVAEKEPKSEVMRFPGQWKDLGTWNTFTEAMSEDRYGKSILNDTCQNVSVVNELNIPVLCMGLKDMIVVAGPDGMLVSDKVQSSYIKPYVNEIDQKIMFAEKSWGSYHVLDIDSDSMTIKVRLHKGRQMNYHSHQLRDEIWTVIAGEGRAVLDGVERRVKPGDIINMAAGVKHTIIADTNLSVIEVQLGEEIDVHDKQKHPLKQ